MTWSPDVYEKALRFAAERHQSQIFPGTDLPYLLHLSMVTAELMRALTVESRSEDEANLAVQCAVLHDTIEDTDATFEIIEERFGNRVAQGVLALTKDENRPKAERMADSLERIRAQPSPVWMVKLADRVANLQAPPHYWTPDKCRGYQEEARTIHRALSEASPYLGKRLLDRIDAYQPFTG